MKKLLVSLLLLWAGGAAGLYYWNDLRNQQVAYRTVAVRRGDLLSTVGATGTLEPEEVVDVGAQIAGEIESFGPDPGDPGKTISYGSRVEEGTILARIADALFKARVDQASASVRKAEADVLQAQAKLQQADRDYERARKLRSRDQISAQEYDTAQAAFETARASLALAESSVALSKANLEEASVNLGYTTIRSPVKGIILDRRVNIGQTVVASLNAPSLFLIAKDLSRMEIWASVNESDVGQIYVGQPVRFGVAAFPGEQFHGKVAQIRLNASMSQNVVTYTVVVAVDNAGGKLLPYLTARVQFEVAHREGVLLVPNAALRWRPPAHLAMPEARSALDAAGPGDRDEPGPGSGSTRAGRPALLWVRRGDLVRPLPVVAGLTDGLATEVTGASQDDADALREGTEVVFGLAPQASSGPGPGSGSNAAGSTPFLPKFKSDRAAPKK
jgi:HlyD family secretion protein